MTDLTLKGDFSFMGLLQVAIGATMSTLGDTYKEFFYCDSIPNEVLVVRGRKHSDKGAHNNGNDNVISRGSKIAVNDGQCMIITDQGHIVDVVATPGEYEFTQSSSPSIFASDEKLGAKLKATLAQIGNAISMGGDSGKEQRVYYINMKEIMDNRFGTQNPVPFRVVDNKIGLDIDTAIRCNGTYTYKITDPLLFFTNVCGNIQQQFDRSQIDAQLKSEFLDALQPGFAQISAMGIRYSEVPGKTQVLKDAMNEALAAEWAERRGISLERISINSVTLPKEDEDMIKQAQRTGMMQNANYAAATMVNAQAEAMQAAAKNSGGAMNGFMGMNMAMNAGGMNAQNLFAMGQQQQAQAQQAAPAADSWTCSCGAVNTGKFCSECASPKPAPAGSWTCSCGTVNTGKFCSECASPKPADQGSWTCSCGAVNTGKFCSECASPRP
jgi:membrane protease subunit (stomatin/prohibitin family)